jgi:hypothetical protein
LSQILRVIYEGNELATSMIRGDENCLRTEADGLARLTELSWPSIACQTLGVYEQAVAEGARSWS